MCLHCCNFPTTMDEALLLFSVVIVIIAVLASFSSPSEARAFFVFGDSLRLHEMGGRRAFVTGTGPLGCVPAELALRSLDGECDPELQRAASLFNSQLFLVLQELNSQFGADVFISANAFRMHMNYVTNPEAFGKTS
ncbi:hypothetical protein B296_00033890 [Ensete ventricosum]|uniref:GDSL esterase/lipase n=1 Tax=Ensete ventricosum TaxID=4639 RepID=A0A426ZXM1_ENSVE|nr:hypothetical protein B296_00033890 [Ensete ventricosum]